MCVCVTKREKESVRVRERQTRNRQIASDALKSFYMRTEPNAKTMTRSLSSQPGSHDRHQSAPFYTL